MSRAKFIFTAIVIAYPIIVYFGLDHVEARMIALALIVIGLARLTMLGRWKVLSVGMPQTFLVVAAMLLTGITGLVSNSSVLLQYYPVLLNALMLALFGVSLIRPPSIIEQIARANDPDLKPAAVPYTRNITIVWCAFFAFNGTMAFYTIRGTSLEFWAIYNGLVSYVLMGVLIGGEILLRRYLGYGPARRKSWPGESEDPKLKA